MTFAQVHDRVHPSVEVAEVQAAVLTDVFVKPWVQDLVATLHRFLEAERERRQTTLPLPNGGPRAPSAMDAYRRGWDWAIGPDGAASKLWVTHMKGPEAGPWGEFLERVRREQEKEMRRVLERAEVVSAHPSTPPDSKTSP